MQVLFLEKIKIIDFYIRKFSGWNHLKGNERISSIGSYVPLHIHLRWMMGKLFTPNVSIMTCVHSTRVLVMVCIESYWAIFIIARTFRGTNIYVDIHVVDLTWIDNIIFVINNIKWYIEPDAILATFIELMTLCCDDHCCHVRSQELNSLSDPWPRAMYGLRAGNDRHNQSEWNENCINGLELFL